LVLISHLLPVLSTEHLTHMGSFHDILLPLQHLTDPNTFAPRSGDPTFAATYQSLIELGHEVTEKIQAKLGDAAYVQTLTEVGRAVRERRAERRTKRRIERVAEPEKAARDKKRKGDRKRDRKKEIGQSHRQRRRETGM